ncbi:MAG: PD40 domain-containing protein [Vicinamibacteria bacterium]|nr:PD40 domain-containing protein [Vicinamibacteria bacterium]MCL4821413.1 PD40 domain-containing protein [Vicinamibacteria bacterium]
MSLRFSFAFLAWLLAGLSTAHGEQAPVPSATPAPPPASDVWLARLETAAGTVGVRTPKRLTRGEGYHNQPAFALDGRTLYYVAQEGSQTDVVGFDLQSSRAEVFRRTPEPEYSPQALPDGSGLSVVRVEADGTQRLWALPFAGEPYPIFEKVKPVGYYAWGDADRAALFVLPGENDADQPTLRLASRRSGKAEVVFRGAGRSIQKAPGRAAVAFTGFGGGECWIREVDVEQGHVTSFARCLEKSMDFAWLPDGSLLMARGSELFRHRPGSDEGWVRLHAFAEPGLQAISRLAVSPDGRWLALVSERPAKPRD